MNSKLIICDWNRTLFNPDTKELYPDALPFLQTCQDMLLVLISREENNPLFFIEKLKIKNYFDQIVVVKEKTLNDFQRIREWYVEYEYWVLGDKIDSEIFFGNRCGYNTIRIRRGKFQDEIPANAYEQALYEVDSLPEAAQLLSQ